jgi:hypothetical protein
MQTVLQMHGWLGWLLVSGSAARIIWRNENGSAESLKQPFLSQCSMA